MAKSNLTAERLRELLSYNPETGEFHWRVRVKGVKPYSIAGTISKAIGYRMIGIAGQTLYAHRLAWLYTYGVWPKNQIDHWNGNRTDNRLINLREATSGQNKQNREGAWSATGHRGVYRAKRLGYYRAVIGFNGDYLHLGQFQSIEEAIAARKSAEIKYFTHHRAYAPPVESHAPHVLRDGTP